MSIWTNLNGHMHDVEKRWRELLAEAHLDLTPAQAEVMVALYRQNGQKATELARQINRAATSFTPILDSLQFMKLICREDFPGDRRAILVKLTAEAERFRGPMMAAAARIDDEFQHLVVPADALPY